jgi:hypothetical protein
MCRTEKRVEGRIPALVPEYARVIDVESRELWEPLPRSNEGLGELILGRVFR